MQLFEFLIFLIIGLILSYLLDFFEISFLNHFFSYSLHFYLSFFEDVKVFENKIYFSSNEFLILNNCTGIKGLMFLLPYLILKKRNLIFKTLIIFFLLNFFRIAFEIFLIVEFKIDMDVFLSYFSNIFLPLFLLSILISPARIRTGVSGPRTQRAWPLHHGA